MECSYCNSYYCFCTGSVDELLFAGDERKFMCWLYDGKIKELPKINIDYYGHFFHFQDMGIIREKQNQIEFVFQYWEPLLISYCFKYKNISFYLL